jgi:transposase InsO family protein
MTNNASEFRSQEFNHALAQLGVKHVHIRAGRPTSNGCVERVQQTLLGGVLEAGLGRLPDAQA